MTTPQKLPKQQNTKIIIFHTFHTFIINQSNAYQQDQIAHNMPQQKSGKVSTQIKLQISLHIILL